MNSRSQPACPYCMTVVHPAAKVCNGCGAVKSTWAIKGAPVVPISFLVLLGAYLITGPFFIYSFFFGKGSVEMLIIGATVTVFGVFLIKWFALWSAEEKWFRRN